MAKRRHKKRQMPVIRVGEVVTPERRRQLGGVMTEVIDRDSTGKAYIKRQRVKIECMLDYYYDKFRINDHQNMAGQKYRELYTRVNFGSSYKVLTSPFLMADKQSDPEARMVAHIDCIRNLTEVDMLLSPQQRDVMRDVCGYDEPCGNDARKKTLLRALDILAKHWGYA